MYEHLNSDERAVLVALNNGQSYGSPRVLKLLETISELRGQLAPPNPSPIETVSTIVDALNSLVTPDIK